MTNDMGHMLRIGAIFDCCPVDVEHISLRLDCVTANGNDAFDKILGSLVRRNEYKYISSCRLMEVKEF